MANSPDMIMVNHARAISFTMNAFLYQGRKLEYMNIL